MTKNNLNSPIEAFFCSHEYLIKRMYIRLKLEQITSHTGHFKIEAQKEPNQLKKLIGFFLVNWLQRFAMP